jgi:ribosomal RNA-processing protein 8
MISKIISQKKGLTELVIADLGCGTGELQELLMKEKNQAKQVLSYDLVAIKPFITVADMKKLPLEKESIDLGVFCLALMGINYIDFLIECTRVLKVEGTLIIAEVTSRLPNFDMFSTMMTYLGYELTNKLDPN